MVATQPLPYRLAASPGSPRALASLCQCQQPRHLRFLQVPAPHHHPKHGWRLPGTRSPPRAPPGPGDTRSLLCSSHQANIPPGMTAVPGPSSLPAVTSYYAFKAVFPQHWMFGVMLQGVCRKTRDTNSGFLPFSNTPQQRPCQQPLARQRCLCARELLHPGSAASRPLAFALPFRCRS